MISYGSPYLAGIVVILPSFTDSGLIKLSRMNGTRLVYLILDHDAAVKVADALIDAVESRA